MMNNKNIEVSDCDQRILENLRSFCTAHPSSFDQSTVATICERPINDIVNLVMEQNQWKALLGYYKISKPSLSATERNDWV